MLVALWPSLHRLLLSVCLEITISKEANQYGSAGGSAVSEAGE